MKFSKYFMLAGAAALLTACSSEEPLNGGQQDLLTDNTPVYGMFKISLEDGTSGTRAEEENKLPEGVLDSGTAAEYAITNGQILIFGVPTDVWNGTDPKTISLENRIKAQYIVAAELQFEDTDKLATPVGNASASYKNVMAKFAKGTFTSSNYSAYLAVCMLNYKPDGKFMPTPGQTFENWATTTIDGDLTYPVDGTVYYKMTNAPVFKDGKHYVLEVIDRSKIFEFEAEVTGTAADFTVQRMAAKVVLNNTIDESFTASADGDYAGDVAVLKGWDMDIVNKKAYAVQNVWTNHNSLTNFLEAEDEKDLNWVHANNRCNWAYGEFYDKVYTEFSSNDFNSISSVNSFLTAPQYIRENMVAYDRMSKGNCTRLVVMAEYTHKDAKGNDVKNFIKVGNALELYTPEEMKTMIQNIIKDEASVKSFTIASTAGMYKITDFVTLLDEAEEEIVDVTIYKKIADACGLYDYTNDLFSVYVNGVVYYPIYIKHFANEQENAGILADKINHLTDYKVEQTGRYGVVRNNWYDLKINSISGPGYPIIPPRPTDEPVDGPTDLTNKFLQVDINVMKWTKRTQGVAL